MMSPKFLRVGLWSLIGLEISLVVAYFITIGQGQSVPNWLDWNGLRSNPVQPVHLFAIGFLFLVLLLFRPRMQRPVSWLLPLALTVLCFYGAVDELTKIHLLLKNYDWKAIYLTILISIPLICRRDLVWIWRAHRSIVLWVFMGLGIFLLGGVGAESTKQALYEAVSSEAAFAWLGQDVNVRVLAEHIRTTVEELVVIFCKG